MRFGFPDFGQLGKLELKTVVLGVTDFGAKKVGKPKNVPANHYDLGISKVRNAITFSKISCKRFAFLFAADQIIDLAQIFQDFSLRGIFGAKKLHSKIPDL